MVSSRMATGFMAAPTSALGLFILFHVLTSIGRASFPTPPTHWGWEPDTTHPAGSSGGVLGGFPVKSGARLEVQVATREMNFPGHSQTPHRAPQRKPLTEECPGARDCQLWTCSEGSGVPLPQDPTPGQGPLPQWLKKACSLWATTMARPSSTQSRPGDEATSIPP